MSFFGFNQKKNAFDELLYFIRRKSNLILKIEKQENDNTVLKNNPKGRSSRPSYSLQRYSGSFSKS